MTDVTVLIVTYNNAAQIGACLDALAHYTRLPFEIIVVDNASDDETLRLLATAGCCQVIANAANVGFAAAVNQAARLARGRYLLLLNPDTLVHDGAVDRLAAYLDSHPAAGICAPRVVTADGRIRHNCFAFETPWSMFWFGVGVGPLRRVRNAMLRRTSWDIACAAPQVVEAVTGAAMLVRRELFERLGGLDERFFMYCEDGDFCLRARRAGWQTWLAPEAVVTHHGGASTPQDAPRLNGMIGRYLVSSRYLYTHKYWGKGPMWLLRWAYGIAGLLFLLLSHVMPDMEQRRQLAKAGELLLFSPAPVAGNIATQQSRGQAS